MSAHTPGPLLVKRLPRERGDIPGARKPPAVVTSDGAYLAVLGSGCVHFRDAEANAHLFAAAPDLLAALQSIREQVESSDGRSASARFCAILDTARAALAKAGVA